MIHDAIARAICCPGGTCVRPEDCDRRKRTTVVNIPLAAEAVIRVYGEQVRAKWRADRSPSTEAEAQAGRYPDRG